MVARLNMVVTLAWLTGLVATASGAGPALRYVADRVVVLDFRLADSAYVESVELWISRDEGWCWEQVCVDRPTPTSLMFTAPQDGRFDLYIVLVDAKGPVLPPPEAGDLAHAVAIVDTLPPLLQLHGPADVADTDVAPRVRQRLTLIDEHLGSAPLRVYYRDAEGVWSDGGVARLDLDGRQFEWSPPAGAAGSELRVVATDLAGNRALAELQIPAGATVVRDTARP